MVIADPGRENPFLMNVQGQLLRVCRDSVFRSGTLEHCGDLFFLKEELKLCVHMLLPPSCFKAEYLLVLVRCLLKIKSVHASVNAAILLFHYLGFASLCQHILDT